MATNKRKFGFWSVVGLVLFTLFWVGLLSGNILWTSDTPPLEIIDDMDNQQKVKAQAPSSFFADGKATRDPVEYTVPRNGTKYNVSLDDADTKNINSIPVTAEVLARGKNRFETMCTPCHNHDGKGNGLVVQKGFANPPSLVRPDAVAYTDGRIFHVISAGQNIMSSYADKLSELDRWCVVHYIRVLQNGGTHPKMTAAPKTEKDNQTTAQAGTAKAASAQ
ncbi:MAG: c-type cytochrome [Candidatus Kapabacteria bacterium]|jgi:mono/diheme cytochrome c family protein|nr:c-type cytochrome [Candidatus Kapabacteria bacterium]